MKRPRGSIDLRGDRYRIRLSVRGKGRVPVYTAPGATFEEAQGVLDGMLRELAGTEHDPASRSSTLGAWGVRWLDAREQTHRDAGGDRQRWNQHVAPADIAAIRLDALTPEHVGTWLAGVAKRCRSRQTAKNANTTLRSALKAAQEAKAISAPRLRDLLSVRVPAMHIEAMVEMDERIKWLRDEQIEAVLSTKLTDDQLDAFVVAVWSALRAGEMHGLGWERILWEDEAAVIARSRKASTKSGTVARIPLLQPAYSVLRRRWERMGKPASGLVWPRDDGSHHARGYDWGWSDHREMVRGKVHVRAGIASRAGIQGITWRDLRHTTAVHLLRGTWAPDFVPAPYRLEEVSRFLRHSSLKVTERHYAQLALDALPVVRGSWSRWSREGENSSHTRDLNSGPTVYETGGRSSDSAWLARRGPAPDLSALVRLSDSVHKRLALGGGPDAIDAALELAAGVYRFAAAAGVIRMPARSTTKVLTVIERAA